MILGAKPSRNEGLEADKVNNQVKIVQDTNNVIFSR